MKLASDQAWRALSVMLAIGGAGTARAQQAALADASPPTQIATPTADAPTQEADIVVTAQKRSETAQRVAAAVTAVDNSALIRSGTTSLANISQLVPSIQVSPLRNQAQIFIRGVGQLLTSPNADPSVAVNINGVYVPTEMSGGAFFDVDRIEVLPGPQGTLYGRNSTGGVVNIITRRPGDAFAANGFVELGDYSRVQGFVGVDVPVGDTFAVRTALSIIKHSGYYSNGNDDQDNYGGRLTAQWKPASGTTVLATAAYSHDGGLGPIYQNNPPAGDPRTLTFDPRALGYGTDIKSTYTSLEVDQDLGGGLALTYLGGYDRLSAYQRDSLWAGPPLALLVNDYRLRSLTQELRLNYTAGPIAAILGGYYFDSKADYVADINPTGTVHSINGPFTARSHGEAAFGQLTYSIAAPFRLTGGLRYSSTDKSLTGANTTTANGATVAVVPYTGTKSLDRLDWKAGFEFDLAPASLLYGSVATGFTPGGLSTAPIAIGNPTAQPFEPVTLMAYTAGVKNRFLDNRLTLNLEGFYYDYKNYQVSARNPVTGQNNVYNATKATIYGAQLDTRFLFTRADQLRVSLSLLHAKADRLTTPAGVFDGYDLPYSPHVMVNASYQHSFAVGASGMIDALVNFQYSSRRWGVYTHSAYTDIDPSTQTDLNLTYHPLNDRWSIGAWVRNLEDDDVFTNGVAGAVPGPAAFTLAPPRTFGARFGFNFR